VLCNDAAAPDRTEDSTIDPLQGQPWMLRTYKVNIDCLFVFVKIHEIFMTIYLVYPETKMEALTSGTHFDLTSYTTYRNDTLVLITR
jgi:hypothetical protein